MVNDVRAAMRISVRLWKRIRCLRYIWINSPNSISPDSNFRCRFSDSSSASFAAPEKPQTNTWLSGNFPWTLPLFLYLKILNSRISPYATTECRCRNKMKEARDHTLKFVQERLWGAAGMYFLILLFNFFKLFLSSCKFCVPYYHALYPQTPI